MDKEKLKFTTTGNYTFSEINDDIGKVKINVMHQGYNPNGTFFEEESLTNNKESFNNKPICCYLELNSNGEVDFEEHNEEEKPCGVVPESNNYEVVEIEGTNWISVEGYIFKEYCPEEYELLKNGNKKISMEIKVLDGFQGKDNFYHVKKFQLLCITILGDDYAPAMGQNATIETFNLKMEDMINKFNLILEKAEQTFNLKNNNNNNNEGGKELKRKDIIAKFSTLEKVEGYSEIVNDNNLTDEELEKKLFSLSVSQLRNSLRESLSNEKIIKKYWDGEAYETNKYYLEDIIYDDSIAIAYSSEDYKYYGIPYTTSGDKTTLDFKKCKRYVREGWREYSDGETVIDNDIQAFANSIVEAGTKEIENVKNNFSVKDSEEYKALEQELNDVKVEFTDLQAENKKLSDENEELKQFKSDKEIKEKENELNQVVEEFSYLKESEGYKELVDNKMKFSKEELEREFKILAFDFNKLNNNKKKFSKEQKQYNFDNTEKQEPSNEKTNTAWDLLD